MRPKDFIAQYLAAHGEAAATSIAPIAVSARLVDGYDADDPTTLIEPSVLVEPVVHPLLEAYMELSSATRRGRFTWAFGLGEECDPTPFGALIDRVLPGTVYHASQTANTRGPITLTDHNTWHKENSLTNGVRGTLAAGQLTDARRARIRCAYPTHGGGQFGAVEIKADNTNLWMKVITHNLVVPDDVVDGDWLSKVNLNLRAAGRASGEPKPVLPSIAIGVLEWAASVGLLVVDPSEGSDIVRLRRHLAGSVVATPAPGRPALALVSLGARSGATAPFGIAAPAPGHVSSHGVVDVSVVARLTAEATNNVVHVGVGDAARMAVATPVDDDRLRDYQRECVGLHLSTELGFVNALDPGMGKTICTLEGMRRRAATRSGYRGLVIVEANVRDQWRGETEKWFPAARTVVVESRGDMGTLTEALTEAGADPVVVITSYALASAAADGITREDLFGSPTAPAVVETDAASGEIEQLSFFAVASDPAPAGDDSDDTDAELFELAVPADDVVDNLGDILMSVRWDDLIADEAMGLRNPSTKLGRALWKLRGNSQVAIPLTGTPIVKSVDDLGRMLSWARNDAVMFHGVRLDKVFDVADDDDLADLTEAIGPLLFRRDKSEIADEVPDVVPEVIKLTPTGSELALATAAQRELKRTYEELKGLMATVEGLDRTSEDYKAIAEGLEMARGAFLGGTTLARQAASDPAAVDPDASAGAALLASQGLIDAATARRGTKRTWALGFCTEQVAAGAKILIFTSFATVAKGLIADLTDAGLRVGEVLGGGGRKRDRHIAEFREGNLDVLVCTSSGERGLNLQNASVVIHYECTWTPDGIVQRQARSQRIGSRHNQVKVVFPIMEGTIEEKVAALVVARAWSSMRVLDGSRGVDVRSTEMGVAFAGLAHEVDAEVLAGRKERNMLLAVAGELVAA